MKSVALIMGSKSDWPALKPLVEMLSRFSVPVEARVMSAHRTPEEAAEFSKGAAKNGVGVIIAAAGKAAHLPGVLAAYTELPVIGVPMKSSFMDGMDSLLSIVQMPTGVPVATVGVGAAENAALLAVQILAVGDADLAEKFRAYKLEMAENVRKADTALKEELFCGEGARA